jgi:hypothetical protein
MIPSLLAGVMGLWLVFLGVLDPSLIDAHGWVLAASACALLVLGLLALRADYLKWPGITDVILGVVLIVLLFERGMARSDAVTFWALFWSGSIAGVVSLWSTFYRHGPVEASDVQRNPGISGELPG